MKDRLVGKPSPEKLSSFLEGNLGSPCDRLLVSPGAGLDAAVLELDDGRVMAVAEDPIFPAPGLPLEIMGFFTVHIGASDVAVTGIPPRYMTYSLLLPTKSPETDARILIESISRAASGLGISIIGGHTGWYDAVAVPIVGGVTVWGTAPPGRWISPGGAMAGDLILMTKAPAVEAAALLGVLYRDRLAGKMSPEHIDSVCGRVREISVVEDALTAFEAGEGVHAMHDATEGGVLGGLWEMQSSSGKRISADIDAVEVPADILALARALDFDPWKAISEGTLLAAVAPEAAGGVRRLWEEKGIKSCILGSVDDGPGPGSVRRGGKKITLEEPGEDPFWDLFFAGLGGGTPDD